MEKFEIELTEEIASRLKPVAESQNMTIEELLLAMIYMGFGAFKFTQPVDIGRYLEDWFYPAFGDLLSRPAK